MTVEVNQIRKWNKPSYLNVNRLFIVIKKVTNYDSDVYKIRYLDNNEVENRYARTMDLHSTVVLCEE